MFDITKNCKITDEELVVFGGQLSDLSHKAIAYAARETENTEYRLRFTDLALELNAQVSLIRNGRELLDIANKVEQESKSCGNNDCSCGCSCGDFLDELPASDIKDETPVTTSAALNLLKQKIDDSVRLAVSLVEKEKNTSVICELLHLIRSMTGKAVDVDNINSIITGK